MTGVAIAALVVGLSLVGVHVLLLLGLAPRRGFRPPGSPPPRRLRVAVIVPCCNDPHGELHGNLLAIARQRREPERLILVARGARDAAVPTLERLRAELPFVRVVLAGPAAGCGQKNHNLIAALPHAADADVYVFADSDIRPDPRWLDDLVAPLEHDPEIGATSALCGLPAADARLVSAAQALFSLHQCHFQRLGAFMWGGSMAVRAAVFDAAGVAASWARTVLDDMVLWHLVRRRARVVTVPAAQSGAFARPTDWGACLAWSVRQVQYVKIHLPVAFHLLLAGELLFAAILLALPASVAFGVPVAAALGPGGACLALMTAFNLAVFGAGRGRSPFLARLGASVSFSFFILYVTVAAWLQTELIWCGIAYQMDDDGSVRSIELRRPELQGEAVARQRS